MDIITQIKEIITLIQSKTDIEEIEYDDKKTMVHIKIRRNITNKSTQTKKVGDLRNTVIGGSV